MFKQMKWTVLCVLAIVCHSVMGATDVNDCLAFLKARVDSIQSFEVKLRRVRIELSVEEGERFKQALESNLPEHGDLDVARKWAEDLAVKWKQDPKWINIQTLRQGDLFKEIWQHDNTRFDGALYWSHSVINRQLDIHDRVRNKHHYNVRDLGYQAIQLTQDDSEKTQSMLLDPNSGGWVYKLKEGEETLVEYRYDNKINQYYKWFSFNKDIYSNHFWYLFFDSHLGYEFPRVKVELRTYFRRQRAALTLYVFEDVKFNSPTRLTDFAIDEVPDKTLVVDYRFKPSEQWYYHEFEKGPANPLRIRQGFGSPMDLASFLHKTRRSRESFTVRESRTSQTAPALDIDHWIQAEKDLEHWPPQKLTVLEFWNIRCGPCVASIPENNALSKWLSQNGGQFISIHSATQKPLAIKKSLTKHPITYPIALDSPGEKGSLWNSTTFTSYGINGIPSYVTIGAEGRILSYEKPTKAKLEKLLKAQPSKQKPKQEDPDIQRLTAIPNAWCQDQLDAGDKIDSHFFVFRPETSGLQLTRFNCQDSSINCRWKRTQHKGQAIYDVHITAQAPQIGTTKTGQVDLIAEYNGQEHVLTIPYKFTSMGLVSNLPASLWFGAVSKGKTVSRRYVLKKDTDQDVYVKLIQAPPHVKCTIQKENDTHGNIVLAFSLDIENAGFYTGDVELLVNSTNGPKQSVILTCSAWGY